MSEENKEPWLNRMALATVVLAVCATLSTFKAGGASTQSVIYQSLASDQWAFYQAKSMKRHLFQLQIDDLKLRLPPGESDSSGSAIAKQIRVYESEVGRYTNEMAKIDSEARRLEAARDDAKLHGKPFGIAVMFLQVAILLNSVAGLLKNKKVWFASIPVGLGGVLLFGDGFLNLLQG